MGRGDAADVPSSSGESIAGTSVSGAKLAPCASESLPVGAYSSPVGGHSSELAVDSSVIVV